MAKTCSLAFRNVAGLIAHAYCEEDLVQALISDKQAKQLSRTHGVGGNMLDHSA